MYDLKHQAVVVSMLKKSINQKANGLPAMLGLLLHSTHTPEKVIETMSRMGLSISVDAIHDAIRSLSAQSCQALRNVGQTLLAAYTYDNFDVSLKTTVLTAEKSVDTLKHLTSGLLFPLQHGVIRNDLKCSYELWQKSRLNAQYNTSRYAMKTWQDIPEAFPDTADQSGLHRHDRFDSWKFLHDLCYHGPTYFA